MRLVKRLSVLALAAALPLAACGGGEGDGDVVDCTNAELTTYTYVVDTAQLPSSPAEATTLALDLDMAEPLRPDNTLGMVIATLASQANLDLTTAVGDAINGGDIILLASLETEALDNAACARMGVFLGGSPSTEPCDADGNCGAHLDGQTSFELATGSPEDTKIDGQVLGSTFSLGPQHTAGRFTIQIDLADLGDDPLSLDLVGARIETTVSDTGLTSGLIGGAITQDDLNTSILPAIHGIVEEAVTADCTAGADPCCVDGSTGATIVDLFDGDGDCVVALEEIQQNELIGALLAPDLDLLDANGNLGPDGTKDSLSIGLGFTATTGEFTVP